MLKNKAVFVPTLIGISVTVAGFIILLFISPIASSIMLLCCLVIMGVFLFSQYSEYSKLNRLCDDIDRILDGDDSISFDTSEYAAKLPDGLIMPKPGPTLLKQVTTAVKLVSSPKGSKEIAI